MSITARGVHIIGGVSAAGSFKQAHHMSDRLLIHQDILSCGPIPQCSDLQEWEKIRISFLRSLYMEWPDIDFKGLETDLLNNVNRLNDFDAIYVWASTGLEDQLLILFVVHLIGLIAGNPEKIRIVQYESLPGRKFLIRTMGELNPEQMRTHPDPLPLTQAHIEQYRAAWAALTSDTPSLLTQLVTSPQQSNKYTIEALKYMLRRYPHSETGLGFWDYQLLANAQKHGPLAARIIGYTYAVGSDLRDGDCVGDLYLFCRLRSLASSELAEPLFTLSGEQTSYRDTDVALTEFGAAVLSGEASSYPTNPIDEWVGGVHLSSSTGNLWFFKDGRLIGANET